jgi:hypothetical protein
MRPGIEGRRPSLSSDELSAGCPSRRGQRWVPVAEGTALGACRGDSAGCPSRMG